MQFDAGEHGRRGGAVGGVGRRRGRLARMVPLPKGVVVRGRDENSEQIAAGGMKMRFFRVGGGCAGRVTDAHRQKSKAWTDLRLERFYSVELSAAGGAGSGVGPKSNGGRGREG